MRVFITGGTGNIGQYVSLAAAKRGHDAVVLSREPQKYTQLAKVADKAGSVRLVQGYLKEYNKLAGYVKGCDAVIHIALGWGNEPVSMCMEDTVPTINLLELSERAGVKKFIYTSSTAVIGAYDYNMDEKHVAPPSGLYGATKAAGEAYVLGFREYCAQSGTGGNSFVMKRNVIRPGYTFSNPPYPGGPSQLDRRFRDITDAVVKNQPIQLIKNDGTQFLSAKQIAEVYMALLESDLNEELFYALSNTFVSWERIAQIAMEEHLGSTASIELFDSGYGDIPMMFNVCKINDLFGLEFTGEDDIREHIKWNLSQSIAALK